MAKDIRVIDSKAALIIEVPHDESLFYHEWIHRKTVSRSMQGYKHGITTVWEMFICNHGECGAVGLMRAGLVIDELLATLVKR